MKEAKLTIIPMPKDTNSAGNVFGGWIMSQIDLAGAVAAREICNNRVVTIAVDQMVFKKPVFVGDVVSFYATVVNVGRTSVKVDVNVVANRLVKGVKETIEVTHATLTYVNVDENGNKKEISK